MNAEQNTQKAKPKGFVAPKPGAFPITQKVVMEFTPGKEGSFVHDSSMVDDMIEVISNRLHPVEERMNMEAATFVDFQDRVARMVYMMMARKLAVSLSEDQKLTHEGLLRPIAHLSTYAPSALVPLIDLFGAVDHEKTKFMMVGQPMLALTYFARASISDLENRRQALVVNTHWPNAKRSLYDFCVGAVNAWAANAPEFVVTIGNQQLRIHPPKFVHGMATYIVMTQTAIRPAGIVRMMNIAMNLENNLNEVFSPALINTLAGLNVHAVTWTSNQIAEHCSIYSNGVEAKLRTTVSAGMNWVPISMLKSRGSAGQLLRKTTEHIFHCPFLLTGETMDLGWMAAGKINDVEVNNMGCNLTPQSTVKHAMVKYVEGMMKNGI